MEESDNIICLIKFGQKTHLEKLMINGEIFFNNSVNFNDLSHTNDERGDKYEGAEWVANSQIEKINVEHPILGLYEFNPVKNSLFKFIKYNYYFLSYSLYVISSKTFINSNIHTIDKKMLEFGDSAVMINNPKQFLDSLFYKLKENNIEYEARVVEYKCLEDEGEFNINPFIKKEEHKHQMEFRIIIKNIDDRHKLVKIGAIENYSILSSAESMTEAVWNAKRKK